MNSWPVVGLAIAAGIIIEAVILKYVLELLENSGSLRQNYRGDRIPISAGITFPASVGLFFAIFSWYSGYDTDYLLFLIGIIGISFLGFIDDQLGQHDTKGLKGHLGALFKGQLTTGGLKAVGGGLLALFLAWPNSSNLGHWILNSLLIALFTNFLNLLDLRPGRAIKGFLLFLAIILLLSRGQTDPILFAPLVGTVLLYAPKDFSARAMMGDAGANVLGLTLGYICVLSLSFSSKIGILAGLVLIHIIAEKYSLTKIIYRVSFLRMIDQWGRRD
ncbi:MAG: hypothetical protein ACOX0E_07905 [Syntrophomonadaceae bacterium]